MPRPVWWAIDPAELDAPIVVPTGEADAPKEPTDAERKAGHTRTRCVPCGYVPMPEEVDDWPYIDDDPYFIARPFA